MRLRLLLIIFVVGASGCATVKSKPGVEKKTAETPLPGVYHKVKPGQTLWRIAKTYNVTLGEIVGSNNISNAARVEENQLIFIPGAGQVKEVSLPTEESARDFVWPVTGKVLWYFNDRKGARINKGIDIQSKPGEFVKAARTGKVIFADYLTGYGRMVILDHHDNYYSLYAQNAKLLVKNGDTVTTNDPIAQAGGDNDSSFVHFQIRKNSREDNPLYYLP